MDGKLQEAIDGALTAARKKRQENGLELTIEQGSTAGTSSAEAKLLELCGIYRRYQWVTFDAIEQQGLPDDEKIRRNYEAVKEYSKNIDSNIRNGCGLILSGSYGTMAVAVLRALIDDNRRGLRVPMCSLTDKLYTMRSLDREEWARYEQRIRNTPLLVIDDLGGENTDQSWILSKVDSIITERYNKMHPIIITTNLLPDELEGTYSGRIIDRLMSTSKLLTFNGKSQRRQNR